MNPLDVLLGAGGAVGAIVFIIGALKKAAPTWMSGKEEILALIFGLLASTGTYLSDPSKFQPGWPGWLTALTAGVGLGMAAGLAYDKVTAPFTGKDQK